MQNYTKATILVSLLMILLSANCLSQPYRGTIFIDPDIINATDSSTILSTTYTGRGSVRMFDRRVPGWVTVNAYLFDVVWNDGLTSRAQVNPEFGDVERATIEAEKYAYYIGKLPNCLRDDVDEIWIHKGVNPFGGGNRSILIHTGQSANYEADGILEETLVHEASHTSLDAKHAADPDWIYAQNMDGAFISTYAKDFPAREDIAESFLTWLAVRYRSSRISQQDFDTIKHYIPNRIAYFDRMAFNMFPIDVTSSISERSVKLSPTQIYPNPTGGEVNLVLQNEAVGKEVLVRDSKGKLILKRNFVSGEKARIFITDPPGIYFVELRSNSENRIFKIIKVY